MNPLRFSKMHALGNDFVVIEAITQSVHLTPMQVQFLADRHHGIGCDQLLLLEKSQHPDCDFFYRIYNQDGSEVAQCGNGARAIGLFIVLQQLSHSLHWRMQTATGMLEIIYHDPEHIGVSLGIPQFLPQAIPLRKQESSAPYHLRFENGTAVEFFAVNVGNPHAIIFCDDIATAPVESLGHAVATHPIFPEQCNVSFVERELPHSIALRVYERGVGITQACGSAAVAAAAVVMQQFHETTTMTVNMPGGAVSVRWPDQDKPIWLEGNATHVFNGEIELMGFNPHDIG